MLGVLDQIDESSSRVEELDTVEDEVDIAALRIEEIDTEGACNNSIVVNSVLDNSVAVESIIVSSMNNDPIRINAVRVNDKVEVSSVSGSVSKTKRRKMKRKKVLEGSEQVATISSAITDEEWSQVEDMARTESTKAVVSSKRCKRSLARLEVNKESDSDSTQTDDEWERVYGEREISNDSLFHIQFRVRKLGKQDAKTWGLEDDQLRPLSEADEEKMRYVTTPAQVDGGAGTTLCTREFAERMGAKIIRRKIGVRATLANSSKDSIREYAVFVACVKGTDIHGKTAGREFIVHGQIMKNCAGGFILGSDDIAAHAIICKHANYAFIRFRGDEGVVSI